MDNVIKLNSQQSLFNSNNRLVDLVIPGNSGVYNLSETYIAIDMNVSGLEPNVAASGLPAEGQLAEVPGAALPSTSAIADVRLGITHQSTGASIYDQCAVPVETLVRNASMFSETRGKVEDIRRVDALRATMKAYTQDLEDVEAASLTGMPPMGKSNPWSSGRFAIMVGVGDTESKYKNREVRIMLKDLFNIGSAEAWDTSVYGDTHIHLELNLNRLQLQQNLAGALDTEPWDRFYHNNQVAASVTRPANIKYKEALEVKLTTSAETTRNFDSIEMAIQYDSLEQSPFWVNQILNVQTTITGTPGGASAKVYPTSGDNRWAVIKSITWDKTTKRVTLGFGTGSHVLVIAGSIGAAGIQIVREVCGIEMVPDAGTTDKLDSHLSIDTIELTAVRRPEMDKGPPQIQYTQFLTTSDQWSNGTSLNRSYFLPANTTNAFMVFPSANTTLAAANTTKSEFSDILGCARIGEYRFTLNGESVTNRAVKMLTQPVQGVGTAGGEPKLDRGSSLHYTLISEAMMNSGRRFHSLDEAVFDFNIPMSTEVPVTANAEYGWATLETAPMKLCYMLALPIPVSNQQTQLTIELEGSFKESDGNMLLYSEVNSVI